MRLTALWWWIDRWRKSTAYTDMTLEEQGAYRNLLDEAHLRGGYLPDDERILAKACGDAFAWKRVRVAVRAKFVPTALGLHNETLGVVMTESQRRAKKQAQYREKHKNDGNEAGNGTGNELGNQVRPPVPVPVLKTGSDSKVLANSNAIAATTVGKTSSVNGRSKRPIFTGQRFVVFDWMLEDMRRILGPENLDKFDVHEWFFDLDARIAKVNITLRREDVWPWLQSELVKESIRRQMPIAHPDLSVIPRLGKQTQRLMAAIASAKDTL